MDDSGLRGSVIGMTGLSEDACSRPDYHEVAVAATGDAAEEAACGQEGRRQVLAQSALPALERELPDGHVLPRPDARDRGVDDEVAGLREEAVNFLLARQIGLD